MALVDLPADRSAVAAAEALAERLLVDSLAAMSGGERRRARRLGRLLDDPEGRELLFALTDEVLRARRPARAMGRLRSLLSAGGVPHSLGPLDRLGLRLAARASVLAAGPVAGLVARRIRAEAHGVVLPADDPGFARHLARRRAEGFGVNVNLLGEAILGDGEAEARLRAVCQRLRRPDVSCMSVKVSALCANLDVWAFEASVARMAERLRVVFRVALEARPPKLVNLDMEEHRDLQLTVAAFRTVLDEPEFAALPAGIALQAYLPDSHAVLDELCRWAAERRQRGGQAVRVRLVKGANLAMERVEAELGGWEQAPYTTKAEADASFKRMLDRALPSVAAGHLRLGVASHNLFDVAWALHRRRELGLGDEVQLEALEGMAPAQARATRDRAGGLLLYTPVVAPADWAAAIAYLARRLDENAAPDGFLRAMFSVTPGSPRWRAEQARFEAAVEARHLVGTGSRRRQHRPTESLPVDPEAAFANTADTDFTVAANRDWARQHLADDRPGPLPPPVTTPEEVDAVLARAAEGAAAWAATSVAERRRLLGRAAEEMAAARGRTLAVMAAETGKTVREGDPEVSEAIDFARWAATSTRSLEELAGDGLAVEPLGTVLVVGPWNFPYAIPANGVLSALAGGNAVVLKPAPEAVATATELVAQLHRAGLPRAAVQLLRCPEDDVGRHLVTHPEVGGVVLTGAYATARLFCEWKPSLALQAETSGKNALVVTGGADVDLAVRDLVRSAFGHAGQKCSAASLAILDAEVHDDPRFLARLADAVRSLRVGPASEPATMMGPLIRPPEGPLRRALTRLDPGERWLVEPRPLDGSGTLWSPGLKVGVEPGSWYHRTECFGPVLGVIRVADLDEAVAVQNATDFGLTGGLHSLDPDEIGSWAERVEVGNAYVNRHTTGAVVGRQPFGGWKRSSVGPGAKTGGPNDVLRFVRCSPSDGRLDAGAALASYRRWWDTTFGVETELAHLRSEANRFRYRPLRGVVVRAGERTTLEEVAALRRAAEVSGVPVEVSAPPGAPVVAGADSGVAVTLVAEDDRALAGRLAGIGAERLRALAPLSELVAQACHRADITVDRSPVTGHGRVELPRWLREQSVSRTRHRHGRIRGGE